MKIEESFNISHLSIVLSIGITAEYFSCIFHERKACVNGAMVTFSILLIKGKELTIPGLTFPFIAERIKVKNPYLLLGLSSMLSLLSLTISLIPTY